MAKKLTIVQWMGACKRVIASGDCDDLKKVLEYLDDEERHIVIQCAEEVVEFAVEEGDAAILRTILEHKAFSGMGSHLIKVAVERNDAELLRLALDYTNPNALIHGVEFEPAAGRDKTFPDDYGEGTKYFMTVEPLGLCAIQGKVELAKVLLEYGARPEGIAAADLMERKMQNLRAYSFAKLEIHLRWNEDSRMRMEPCGSLKRLPPWAYGLYCQDIQAAEFFLGLGEDRWSLEVAMAISLVSNGEMIRILQEKKPKLMAALEPKFILRRFRPEVVKQYFSAGQEIPADAVELMGTYLFEDYDLRIDRSNLTTLGIRDKDFVEVLKYLLKNGYRLTKNDVERLTMWMVYFRSERLLNILKGKVPQGIDVSQWIDYLPLGEKEWGFGKKLMEAGIRFRCVIDKDFKCYGMKHYMELNRMFKLVDFELRQPEVLDCMSASALFNRSKRSMALLWKQGLINKENLNQAVKLICELQLTELYEFSAELAGTTGGSEVRYEL